MYVLFASGLNDLLIEMAVGAIALALGLTSRQPWVDVASALEDTLMLRRTREEEGKEMVY